MCRKKYHKAYITTPESNLQDIAKNHREKIELFGISLTDETTNLLRNL